MRAVFPNERGGVLCLAHGCRFRKGYCLGRPPFIYLRENEEILGLEFDPGESRQAEYAKVYR